MEWPQEIFYNKFMPISDLFKEAADNCTGTLSEETEQAMKSKHWIFRSFSRVNEGREIPEEDWETLVEELGGENAIKADFNSDSDPAFTVTHIASGKTASGNGSIITLADLWLQIQEQ